MDEAVTHYINSHQTDEGVHVDANSLTLNVQDDGGGRVAILHSQTFSTPLCRQVSVGEQVTEGQWGEELIDPDGRLAALMAQLAGQQARPQLHHKAQAVRADVDTSIILDSSMRLFHGQALDPQTQEPIIVEVPPLPPLPPLQEMKRCQESDWFNKAKTALKDDQPLVESDGPVLEMSAGASPAQNKHHSKKSLPHKKRISRKLKKNNGNSTPQQDIVVISYSEHGQEQEILPDNFVQQEHMQEETHHIAHETCQVRPMFICQLCGEFYGEEQLKFYHHLKQHYEPHIIIENPVPDLGIDKMTNSCIVDNVTTIPDSIVELSLENHIPKTIYQSIDKHVLYTTSDKTLTCTSNKVQYSMASMDKEPVQVTEVEKTDLYETLDKLELYSCGKCSKTFRKAKQCEAHMKEAHSNMKLEEMSEFSEPEDLMEGIHVSVEEPPPHYEHAVLPHLTIDNGHAQHDSVHWYSTASRNTSTVPTSNTVTVTNNTSQPSPAGHTEHSQDPGGSGESGGSGGAGGCGAPYCGMCSTAPRDRHDTHFKVLKEEILRRILESDVAVTGTQQFSDNIITEPIDILPEEAPPDKKPDPDGADADGADGPDGADGKKKQKRFECPQCARVFQHRNSLLYHLLSHGGKQQVCRECGKGFYTAAALKIHKRVHNGDRPYKCEVCGRDFRQWSDLKYHKVSIHSTQKMFKCEYCGKEFARKYSLNVHRRIHTGEKNYKCEYCNKTFRASSYRLSHMRTHTGDKPHKCPQCDKCFRVAGDLRRHMLIHDKVRNRLNNDQKQNKNVKDNKKSPDKPEEKYPVTVKLEVAPKTIKKIAVASTTKMPPNIVRVTEKKSPPKATKKNQTIKKGAPNVTIDQLDDSYTNVEVFDTRQDTHYNKFKDVYNDNHYVKTESEIPFSKQIIGYKEEQSNGRDFATLRPIFRNNVLCDNVEADKIVFRTENTDGKMQVYKQIEQNKEFSSTIVPNSQESLNDLRHLEREVRSEIQGEENGFIERLTALYNIPAV